MTCRRIVGTETEYGILRPGDPLANVIALSAEIVLAYLGSDRPANAPTVQWDYTSEDPLNDMRGRRLSRVAAHPSQLTDDPNRAAPSGTEMARQAATGINRVERPGVYEQLAPVATATVLANGARLYVDHAHPEYSSPETQTPRETVLFDRAGDYVMQQAMIDVKRTGKALVLYKNNGDGKGASYGTHENYLVNREVPFAELVAALIPFFVTRPIICGSGRVGLGQKSQRSGFQISQRADYVEALVGLETTFNRPIVNTRDEPHADPTQFRRLHVIGGDANLFDISTLLRIGTTSIVLWLVENGKLQIDEDLMVADPVAEAQAVSHDPDLQHKITMKSGRQVTAIAVQQDFLAAAKSALATGDLDSETAEILERWEKVLTGLETERDSVAREVEWVAKLTILDGMRQRLDTDWSDDRIKALDLQWADLRPENGLVNRLDQAGRVERLFSAAEVAQAATTPPIGTRAQLRGAAVANLPEVVRAGWTGLVVDLPEDVEMTRIQMLDPTAPPDSEMIAAAQAGDVRALVARAKKLSQGA